MAETEIALAVFLLVALFASLVSRKVRTPYTTLLVLVGLAIAAIPVAEIAGVTGFFNNLASGGLFIGLILPPLLFESIMSVRVADFRAVYRPALVLATGGVLISVLVVGVVLWKVLGLDPVVSFLFAALISPTDVATVLEIFARVNVPAKLATLIEMESVFNDATGITIFTIVLTSSTAAALQPLQAVAQFVYVLGGGVLVGVGVAWLARFVQKEIEDTVSQVVLTLVAVYGSYGLAAAFGFSGIIAVAMTGVFYGGTILPLLRSKQAADATREFWNILAFVANAVAFFFIGISTNIFLLVTGVGVFLVAYGVVVMARITSVYPILSLTKVSGLAIPNSWMNTATLGGMRGALAIVLVSAIPFATRAPVATLTFGVVMLSILLQGPLFTSYTGRTFGRQEKLSNFGAYEGMYDMDVERSAQALSPDGKGRDDDELR
ncbi:MAG: sodium:proton antiporter [Thaumarchaeota archaeon]|nr:sodium:proton antiporter [Nitrososphaerota archaeon]